MMSTVVFSGNLTRDPELRFTTAGHAVVSFSVAVADRRYNQETRTWDEGQPTFWRCVAWRQVAENVAESLTKGSRVVVTGNVQTRAWTNKEGEERTSLEVEVQDIGASLRYDVVKATRATSANDGSAASPDAGFPASEPAMDKPPF